MTEALPLGLLLEPVAPEPELGGIKRRPLESTNLHEAGYDRPSRVLEVRFHHGGTYRYYGVPIGVWRALLAAKSHGKFHARHIKGTFDYRRVATT